MADYENLIYLNPRPSQGSRQPQPAHARRAACKRMRGRHQNTGNPQANLCARLPEDPYRKPGKALCHLLQRYFCPRYYAQSARRRAPAAHRLRPYGFDNISILRYVHPRLATMVYPLAELVQKALEQMFWLLGGGSKQTCILKARLVPGATV